MQAAGNLSESVASTEPLARSKTTPRACFGGRGPEQASQGTALSPTQWSVRTWSQRALTKKTGFKQRSRRYKLVAGAGGERFKVRLEWTEAQEPSAPAIVPEPGGVVGPPRLAHHTYAGLLIISKRGTEAHPVSSIPGDTDLRH